MVPRQLSLAAPANRQCDFQREAALLRLDRSHAISDMLAPEPHGIAAALLIQQLSVSLGQALKRHRRSVPIPIIGTLEEASITSIFHLWLLRSLWLMTRDHLIEELTN